MKKYLLIKPSEDGEPCTFLDDTEELLSNPRENFGITKFLDHIPKEDPMYWKEGNALLLEVRVLKPKVIATAYRLEEE